MLKKILFVFLLLAVLFIIGTNHSHAGRNCSKELDLEEARSIYSKANTLKERAEAYKYLRRFEPEDIGEIEKSLALSLVSSSEEEHRKLAVMLYGRALIAKNEFEPKELGPFCHILNSLLSLTHQENLIMEYLNSCKDSNAQQIRSTSFKLLGLLKDIPEGCEIITSASSNRLENIDPNENLLFFRLLVEKIKMWQPAIISCYISLLEQNRYKFPFPDETIIGLYKIMLKDDRFRTNIGYICDYTSFCHHNKRYKAAKKLLIEVLEEERFDQASTNNLRLAIAISYTNLKKHKNAIAIIEEINPLFLDKEYINLSGVLRVYHLYKLGNSEKAAEAIHQIAQSSLSHLSAQRDNRKAEQRKKYVEAIKFDLAQKEKEKTTVKESKEDIEKKAKPSAIIVSKEIGDSFLEKMVPTSSRPTTSRIKKKTRKQADPGLNRKRESDSSRKKGEKEEPSFKKTFKNRTAEELPNSSYKILVDVFSIFVGKAKWGSCKITVEEVGHLFESLGHTYSKARGHGGHSMILCNKGEKEEGVERKAFTFGSKKKLHPAAIVDIASCLLEYRIYPKEFEKDLQKKGVL